MAESHVVVEESDRRVRVVVGGETVADSRRAKALREGGRPPVYYLPPQDVRMDLLAPTGTTTHCPWKGDARYWTVRAGGKEAADAAWAYPDPKPECAPIKDHLAFYARKVDALSVE